MKLQLLFVFLVTIFFANTVFAVNKTFTQAVSYDWNVAGNWSPSGVPAAVDNVTIPASKSVVITTSVSRTGTTTIAVDGTLSIITGGTFTNTGAVTLNGIMDLGLVTGTATLNNNSGGTITINGSGSLAGNNGYLLIQASSPATGVVNNAVGATISMNNVAYIETQPNNSFNNAGTINSTNSLLFQYGGTLNNTGTINNSTGLILGNAISGLGTGGVVSGSLYTNPSGSSIGADFSVVGFYNCLSFNNGLTNNGIIVFNADGTTACESQDRITVTGNLTLGGTFTVPGSPAVGNYVVMTYTGTKTGAFTNSNFVTANGKYANITATGGNVTLSITNSAVLPVELFNFTATTEGSKTNLTWATASETNNKGFDIETSKDGVHFQALEFVKGRGTTSETQNYTFTHRLAAKESGILYYRLKQMDFDGQFEYSKIIVVRSEGKQNSVAVYPNPSNGLYTIVPNEKAEIEQISLMTVTGQSIDVNMTNNQLDLSNEAAGVYFLQVNGENIRLIKN